MKNAKIDNILNLYFPKTKDKLLLLKEHRLLSYYYTNSHIALTDIEKKYLNQNQKKNIKLFSEIILLNKYLDEKNISHIFLKGVVLSGQIYGDIGIRECRDIDFLIDKADIEASHNIITSLGYELKEKKKLKNNYYKKYFHHFSYFNREKKIMIELHWRPFSISDFFSIKSLKEVSKTVNINNFNLPVFDNENYLIYLCTHGALHMFCEFIWILDIAKFIKTQSIELNRLKQLTKYYKNERIVSLGLSIAKHLFDAELPKKFIVEKNSNKLQTIVLNQLGKNTNTNSYKLIKSLYFNRLKRGLMFKLKILKFKIFRTLLCK